MNSQDPFGYDQKTGGGLLEIRNSNPGDVLCSDWLSEYWAYNWGSEVNIVEIYFCPGVAGQHSAGPRFGKPRTVLTWLWWHTSRPGRVSSKCIPRMHFNLQFANNNNTEVFDMLLTGTMLIITKNPGPLPSRSLIRQIRAESGPGRIWDHDTGSQRALTNPEIPA